MIQFLISDTDTKSAERLCTFLMTQNNWDLNWTGKVEKKYFRFKIAVSDHPQPQRKSLLHPEMRKKLTNSEKQRPQWECAFCWGFLFLKWLSRSKQRPANTSCARDTHEVNQSPLVLCTNWSIHSIDAADELSFNLTFVADQLSSRITQIQICNM